MQPFFLPGASGPLFCIYHAASGRGRAQGLVYLPPFAEEMNRGRRMAAMQARRLAALGVDVLLLDPYGTGDSAGDFGDATWDGWRADAELALDWLAVRCGGQIGLWGLRLGALLAADVAAARALPLSRLLLWQPVTSGERFLTQFLRLRIAAGMADEGGKESTKELRARLAAGERLEIGGYEVSRHLAEPVSNLTLEGLLSRPHEYRVDWMEVASGHALNLSAAGTAIVDSLERQERDISVTVVRGEPFWTIQELTLAPALLDATDELFQHE